MNLQLALTLAIRSFAPPLLALILVWVWHRSSASNRRMVWLMCFGVLALLPLFLLKLPASTIVHEAQAPLPEISAPVNATPKVRTESVTPAVANQIAPSPARNAEVVSVTGISGARSLPTGSAIGGARYAMIVWGIGALLVMAHWFAGLMRLSRLPLRRVEEGDLIEQLRAASQTLGLQRLPGLSMSSQAAAPMVFGHFRPQIVLPPQASDWSAEALEAVFLHECAHMRRGDWLGLMFSRFLCALYWFNPLTWLAARQVRAECEAAADDTVILAGVSPGSYAGELLRIATTVSMPPVAGSLALLEVAPLKKRIERVLEKNRSRGPASRSAIGAALVFSLALSAALGFTYRVVDGGFTSHDGFANLGHGEHIRIIAVVERTATGTRAWNMLGEPLPNSFPVPENFESDTNPGENRRYIVFAHTAGSIWVQDSSGQPLPADTMGSTGSSQPGIGYSVKRIDEDTVLVTSLLSNGKPTASVRCKVWSDAPSPSQKRGNATSIVFDSIPMKAASGQEASPALDVSTRKPPSDISTPGSLIGIADLQHPEWGYWRPDGTPMPPIEGVFVPGINGESHPKGNIIRGVGFLFRGREGSSDDIACADSSGVLLASGTYIFHTRSGRYNLDRVFLNPDIASMQLISKAPQADRVVSQLKLTLVSPSKAVDAFFANRIPHPVNYFAFDKKIAPAPIGSNISLRFLTDKNATPPFESLSTDWEDDVVAVRTDRPDKFAGAKLMEHGYDYYDYPRVPLFPKDRR